jgi:hypothetical protein
MDALNYSALGFTTWQLFACLRVAMWGNISPVYQEDRLTCFDVRSAIKYARCEPVNESVFTKWCYNMYVTNGVDCSLMSYEEQIKYRKRLRGCV